MENSMIIRGEMAYLGCLLMCTFGNYLLPLLVAELSVFANIFDLGHCKSSNVKVIKNIKWL